MEYLKENRRKYLRIKFILAFRAFCFVFLFLFMNRIIYVCILEIKFSSIFHFFHFFYLKVKLNAAPTIAITIRHNSSIPNWKRIPQFIQTRLAQTIPMISTISDIREILAFPSAIIQHVATFMQNVCQTDFDGKRLLRKKIATDRNVGRERANCYVIALTSRFVRRVKQPLFCSNRLITG